MAEKNDSDWEEEECYVLTEISGILDANMMTNCEDECRIMNLSSDKPIMQIGSYLFMGEYMETQGTAVIFEPNPENNSVKYLCKTTKKLAMNRAFLKQKQPPGAETASEVEEMKDSSCAEMQASTSKDTKDSSSKDGT